MHFFLARVKQSSSSSLCCALCCVIFLFQIWQREKERKNGTSEERQRKREGKKVADLFYEEDISGSKIWIVEIYILYHNFLKVCAVFEEYI